MKFSVAVAVSSMDPTELGQGTCGTCSSSAVAGGGQSGILVAFGVYRTICDGDIAVNIVPTLLGVPGGGGTGSCSIAASIFSCVVDDVAFPSLSTAHEPGPTAANSLAFCSLKNMIISNSTSRYRLSASSLLVFGWST